MRGLYLQLELSPELAVSAAALAHLGALQHLQLLCLEHTQLEPAHLQQLAAITSLRGLVIFMHEESSDRDLPISSQPASALEPALAALGACHHVRHLLLAAPDHVSQGRREQLQEACDRVVAGSGRQDLVAEVESWGEDDAWEWMLGQAEL
jgi:hypothetical protein